MESAKGPSKSVAIRKFILLYVFSLLIIIPAIYFSFNTPASLFKKSIQQYKTAAAEEGLLLNKTDAITTYINKIIETDRSYQVAMNVTDKEKFKESLGEYTNEISSALQDLENDSASRQSSVSRRHANNYLFMFRNFLEYRDAFSNDFAALESRKDLPVQFRVVLDSLKSCQLQRESLRTQLAAAINKSVATGAQVTNNSNADAANRANDKLMDDLQNKLRQIQADLTNCNQQKTSLSQAAASQPSAATITQQQMAALLTDAGKKIYAQALQGKNFKGGTIEQRAYFACARQIFEEAKTHQGSSDIDDYLKNIDGQIKKLSY
jgi:hypothetical protein